MTQNLRSEFSTTQAFLADSTPLLFPVLNQTSTPTNPQREAVQILIIGSQRGIDQIVRRLYLCDFAEVNEWSPLLPLSDRWMRSLIRYVLLD